jgi:hypothetical protein
VGFGGWLPYLAALAIARAVAVHDFFGVITIRPATGSGAAPVVALHLVSGAGQSFST